MDTITLHIGGDNRHISVEVLLKQVAAALCGVSLQSGQHEIVIERSGAIRLNDMKVFEPSRPLIAKKGA